MRAVSKVGLLERSAIFVVKALAKMEDKAVIFKVGFISGGFFSSKTFILRGYRFTVYKAGNQMSEITASFIHLSNLEPS